MLLRMLLATAGTIMIVGCAAVPAQPKPSSDSPTNPAAVEAPVPLRSQTLALNEDMLPRPATNPKELMPEMSGMGHGMGGMQHDMKGMQHGHDMEGMKHVPPATQPGENAAISAPRWTPTTISTTGPATAPTLYTCKMHPEVISNQPGKCPKCGMNLVPKRDAKQPEHSGHGGRQ
jgi:uncharacterized protein involved in copper resistance